MFTLDELFSKKNQRASFEHFSKKHDGVGADGVRVSEMEDYWRLNGADIIDEIRRGEYEPAVVKCTEIIGGSGKRRVISNLAIVDRFITRLLCQKLRRYIEPTFQQNSYAYQEGKGVLEAVMKAHEYVSCGNMTVAELA